MKQSEDYKSGYGHCKSHALRYINDTISFYRRNLSKKECGPDKQQKRELNIRLQELIHCRALLKSLKLKE